MSWRLARLVVRLGSGVLLFYISLSLIIALLRTPQFQQFLIVTGLAVGGLWWCYSKLPGLATESDPGAMEVEEP